MSHEELIRATLHFPWHLRAYERWLALRSADADDYLYTQQRVRLTPCDEDQLAIPAGLSIGQDGKLIAMYAPGQAHAVALPGVNRRDAEKLISALRSHPTLIELPFAAGVPAEVCDRVLEAGFGKFIFAPEALARLEASCSGAEIVRFPGSPYEIVRNYWTNVGTLSVAIDHTLVESRSTTSFVDWLRGLHVQLLLGADLRTFYCPSSPVALRRVEPGALFTVPSKILESRYGVFVTEGPRVNASAVGGLQYDRLLSRSVGTTFSESRSFAIAETSWGRLITARARAETQVRQWFLPPRPFSDQHWDELFTAWNSAMQASGKLEAVAQLGRFHWCFVHLHPFSCANQSLAFALINWALKRSVGSGIPHLILDQLALRYDCAAYVRLFVRAVSNWSTTEAEPGARHMERVRKRQVLDGFIARLAAAKSDSDANAILDTDESAARSALLLDDGL